MLFNIVANDSEKLYENENPTYDEIIRFIKQQMNIINPLLTYIDDDGKSYYVNCTNDINEIKKKLAIIKKVNLYITLQSWTCEFCTYEENTEEKCEVCGQIKK
ncbi:unnamed protein product [Paramecium primaurelia]|uniref:RanBP2-type domain-containing protein n=1 Tax=Paramecium primaurelia TaxID=5886 RepID=A0A8S1P126_PARPR|nr:unnamed protein product [Paramecium primaurelia]